MVAVATKTQLGSRLLLLRTIVGAIAPESSMNSTFVSLFTSWTSRWASDPSASGMAFELVAAESNCTPSESRPYNTLRQSRP
jgi:hypothetical protein